jgi:hypothetical protein
VSAISSALIVILVGALVSAPPSLPPESAPEQVAPPTDGPPEQDPPPPEPPGRTTLPPGLQPVPFPLENRRPPPSGEDGHSVPVQERRSIVDLRDPFNRPPPRPRGDGQRDPVRLLMPDLKDPFAPGVRRVRSKTLDLRVPNDIRDPFRSPPPSAGERPVCAKTTRDGVVVQTPGKRKLEGDCQPSQLDLRDPFDRNR